MLTRIKDTYLKSATNSLLNILFVNKDFVGLDKTYFGKLTNSFSNPIISEVFVLLAIFITLYESLFVRYTGNLSFFALILLLLALFFTDKSKILISKVDFWFLAFLLTSLVSGLLAATFLDPKMVLLGWLLFAQFYLVILVSKSFGISTLRNLLFITVPMVLAGLYQFVFKVRTPATWLAAGEGNVNRVFGFLGSPNVFGALLVFVILISVTLYIRSKVKSYLIYALLSTSVLGLTLSRSSWLALFAAGLVLTAFLKPKALYFSPFALIILTFSRIRERIFYTFSDSYILDSTLDGRIWSFINGIHIFKQNPFLGTGPGTHGGQLALNFASQIYLKGIQDGYTALYFTDNQWLEILVQTGILGCLAFWGFVIAALTFLIRKYLQKEDIIALGAASCLVAFVVMGLFANILEFAAVAMPLGLILGVGLGKE